MPVEVVKQMKIYIDGYELSCGSNRLDIVKKAEMLDKTD